uniref:Uncharacterized protein n=1 Tax=Arundo donax TaxID=35708 RepID=A0A0A9CZZ4_ARUDO
MSGSKKALNLGMSGLESPQNNQGWIHRSFGWTRLMFCAIIFQPSTCQHVSRN